MKTKPRATRIAGLCAALAMAAGDGCGGDDSARCPAASACGGNLVGEWSTPTGSAGSCLAEPSSDMQQVLEEFCSDTSIDSSAVKLLASATFANDGTFSENISVKGAIKLNIPLTCLVQQGTAISCTKLPAMNPMASALHCVRAGDLCVCSSSADSQQSQGSYSVDSKSGVLTQTPDGGTAVKSEYCVEGDQLSLNAPTASKGMLGDFTLRAKLLLKRK